MRGRVGKLMGHAALLGHVVEYDHDAGRRPVSVVDRGGRIRDCHFRTIAAQQQHTFGQIHCARFLKTASGRTFDGQPSSVENEGEDGVQRLPESFHGAPSGEPLRDRVQVRDHPGRVGGHDAIPDGFQGDESLLLLPEQAVLGPAPLGEVPDRDQGQRVRPRTQSVLADLDRELGPVPPARKETDRGRPRCDPGRLVLARSLRDMDSAETRGDQLIDRLAQQFLGPAEALCGLAIHGDDAPPPVHDHHRVGTGVEQPSEPLRLKDVLAHCAILATG